PRHGQRPLGPGLAGVDDRYDIRHLAEVHEEQLAIRPRVLRHELDDALGPVIACRQVHLAESRAIPDPLADAPTMLREPDRLGRHPCFLPSYAFVASQRTTVG